MPHYGTLRDFSFQMDVDDIRGTVIYGANDQKLGKIEDVIFDHATGAIRYVVVETGGWFTHKKFLVPADRVHSYDKDKDAFQVDILKDQIERTFPKYEEKATRSEKEWADFESEYKRAWQQDPVLHRTDRIDLEVTPPGIHGGAPPAGPGVPLGSLGEELHDFREHSQSSAEEKLAQEDEAGEFTPTRLAGKFPATAESANKIDMVPAGIDKTHEESAMENEYPVDENPPANPTQQEKAARADVGQWHPRMKRFEEVLRKNRVDVTASCPSCQPAKDKAA